MDFVALRVSNISLLSLTIQFRLNEEWSVTIMTRSKSFNPFSFIGWVVSVCSPIVRVLMYGS